MKKTLFALAFLALSLTSNAQTHTPAQQVSNGVQAYNATTARVVAARQARVRAVILYNLNRTDLAPNAAQSVAEYAKAEAANIAAYQAQRAAGLRLLLSSAQLIAKR